MVINNFRCRCIGRRPMAQNYQDLAFQRTLHTYRKNVQQIRESQVPSIYLKYVRVLRIQTVIKCSKCSNSYV